MKEQLISFEVAKLARERGFDWECNFLYRTLHIYGTSVFYSKNFNPIEKQTDYNDWFSAPTQSLLQKWLREEHEINVESNYLPNLPGYKCLFVPMTDKISTKEKYALFSKYYGKELHSTYEEALEEGLLNALQLI